MAEVAITGSTMLIDEEDIPLIADGNVWISRRDGYAQIWRDGKKRLVHRLLSGARKNEFVDHANGNKLDNQRMNLRICSKRENGRNRRGPNRNNPTGYRGVSIFRKKWVAHIVLDGVLKYLGIFNCPEDAAMAFDRAARFHFGSFAGRLNFPATQNTGGIT